MCVTILSKGEIKIAQIKTITEKNSGAISPGLNIFFIQSNQSLAKQSIFISL
jgi:hypothetical protein